MGRLNRYHRDQLMDDDIEQFYSLLIQSGRERTSYYCCPPRRPAEYAEMVRSGGPWWLVTLDGEMAGIFYLTDIIGKCADVHFAYLPSATLRIGKMPTPVAISRFMLASTLYDTYQDGVFMVDTLIGKIPAWNKSAINKLSRIGATIAGSIPNCCYSHDSQAMHDGVFSYFTRETVSPEWAHI